jgi:hypothetical protein
LIVAGPADAFLDDLSELVIQSLIAGGKASGFSIAHPSGNHATFLNAYHRKQLWTFNRLQCRDLAPVFHLVSLRNDLPTSAPSKSAASALQAG